MVVQLTVTFTPMELAMIARLYKVEEADKKILQDWVLKSLQLQISNLRSLWKDNDQHN